MSKEISYYNKGLGLSLFATEEYRKINPIDLARSFLLGILSEASSLGFTNLREDIADSVHMNVFTNDRIKSLNEILIYSMDAGYVDVTVITTFNYINILSEQELETMNYSGNEEKVIGYVFGVDTRSGAIKENKSKVESKYTFRMNLNTIFRMDSMIALFGSKYNILGNINASSNIANKLYLKVDHTDMQIERVNEELESKAKKILKFLLNRDPKVIGVLGKNDSLEMGMPSFDSQEKALSLINKELAQLTGLSLNIIEGTVSGGLGDDKSDLQNEKVYKRIANVLYVPIFNYIQRAIFNIDQTEKVEVKPQGLEAFAKLNALGNTLNLFDADILSIEEKREMIKKYF